MVEVKIVDISLSNYGFVVFLKHIDDEKTLPIFIGVPEAQAIAVQFNKLKTPRPLTHDLLKNMLSLLECEISKVVVSDLIDNTFYAKIYLNGKNGKFQIDSRPSDAIALALRFEVPIFVEENVMHECSIMVKGEDEIPDREKTELEILQEKLTKAVSEERYEDAADFRDQIKKITEGN